MKPALLILTACGVVLAACADEPPPPRDLEHDRTYLAATMAETPRPLLAEDVATTWPATTNVVLETFDLMVGYGVLEVPGRIVVLAGREPLPAGSAPGETVAAFAAGKNVGEVTLPAGKHGLTVQVLDEAGLSLGPQWSCTLELTVERMPTPPRVRIVEPKDGARVAGSFTIKFAVDGMQVVRAGADFGKLTRGHHHLLIDRGSFPYGLVIPTDDRHLHFDDQERSTVLELPPGEHSLTLQFADAGHKSYGPRMAETIRVTVEGR